MIHQTAKIVLATVAGVALSGSAALADLAFAPPAGWNSATGQVAGRPVNVWRAPQAANGFAQDISVVQDRYPGTLPSYVALNKATLAQNSGAQIGESDVSLCNGIAGKVLTFTARHGSRDVIAEQLYTGIDGRYYVLTYARTAGEAELPEAVRALGSACPRSHVTK